MNKKATYVAFFVNKNKPPLANNLPTLPGFLLPNGEKEPVFDNSYEDLYG